MAAKNLIALFSALSLTHVAHAWGTLGHETVALIAQHYVTSATKSWAQGILGSTNSTYLADISTWADSYRYTSAGKFSAPYHFIDAEDNPPSTCNVDYNRDCGSSGCSVSAIGNYTSRVQETSLSKTERQNALKFIVHIVGDIHQPLHDEALDVGGNNIDVTFNGASTNLHHIWDTEMPEKLVGGYSMADAQTWANTLIGEIDSGSYKSEKSSWLSSANINDPVVSALSWASEANAYVCSAVMPNGVTVLESGDLDGSYYNGNTGVIEIQIARAGYRLAAWLNLIATGSTGLSKVKMAKRDAEPLSIYPPATNDRSRAKMARAAYGHVC